MYSLLMNTINAIVTYMAICYKGLVFNSRNSTVVEAAANLKPFMQVSE